MADVSRNMLATIAAVYGALVVLRAIDALAAAAENRWADAAHHAGATAECAIITFLALGWRSAIRTPSP